jgi:hypothetical protein
VHPYTRTQCILPRTQRLGGKLANYEINFRLALFSDQSNSICFEINCLVCFELPRHLYCKTVFTIEAVRPWYISLTQMRRCSSFYLRGNYATVWLRFPHYLLLVVRWTARAIDFYCAASSLQQYALSLLPLGLNSPANC